MKSLKRYAERQERSFPQKSSGKRVDYYGSFGDRRWRKIKSYINVVCRKLWRWSFSIRSSFHDWSKKGYATNVKGANRIIERNRPEVGEVLADVIGGTSGFIEPCSNLHRLEFGF